MISGKVKMPYEANKTLAYRDLEEKTLFSGQE